MDQVTNEIKELFSQEKKSKEQEERKHFIETLQPYLQFVQWWNDHLPEPNRLHKQETAPNGRYYYWNLSTGESSWTRPEGFYSPLQLANMLFRHLELTFLKRAVPLPSTPSGVPYAKPPPPTQDPPIADLIIEEDHRSESPIKLATPTSRNASPMTIHATSSPGNISDPKIGRVMSSNWTIRRASLADTDRGNVRLRTQISLKDSNSGDRTRREHKEEEKKNISAVPENLEATEVTTPTKAPTHSESPTPTSGRAVKKTKSVPNIPKKLTDQGTPNRASKRLPMTTTEPTQKLIILQEVPTAASTDPTDCQRADQNIAYWQSYNENFTKLITLRDDLLKSEVFSTKETAILFKDFDKLELWIEKLKRFAEGNQNSIDLFLKDPFFVDLEGVLQTFSEDTSQIIPILFEQFSSNKKFLEYLKHTKMSLIMFADLYLVPLDKLDELYDHIFNLLKTSVSTSSYEGYVQLNQHIYNTLKTIKIFACNSRYFLHLEELKEAASGAPKKLIDSIMKIEKGHFYRKGLIEMSWPKRSLPSTYMAYIFSGYLFVILPDEKKFKFIELFEFESVATIKRENEKFTLLIGSLGTTITFKSVDKEKWIKSIELAVADVGYVKYALIDSDKKEETKDKEKEEPSDQKPKEKKISSLFIKHKKDM